MSSLLRTLDALGPIARHLFPVDMAREAQQHLSNAGASATYREIDDLSHAYGADLSAMILDWLLA